MHPHRTLPPDIERGTAPPTKHTPSGRDEPQWVLRRVVQVLHVLQALLLRHTCVREGEGRWEGEASRHGRAARLSQS